MKINCNVAQDLMQPYVEDILSKDSRDLLEEHISECDTCKLRLDEIRSINQELDGKTEAGGKAVLPAYDEDAVTFKDFKKWISFRRAIAVIVTLTLTISLCIGIAYYIQAYQSYIPFEETGITVDENGMICTDQAYQMCFGELYETNTSGNITHEIMFMYLTSSIYSRHFEKPEKMIIWDPKELDVDLNKEVTEVYYASPKFLKKTKSLNFKRELMIPPSLSQTERQALIEEMMAESVLLWKRD